MADARYQKARHGLQCAEDRLTRQRAMVSELESLGEVDALARARGLLQVYEDLVERFRERVAFLAKQYGVQQRREFGIIATPTAGTAVEVAPLEAHLALAQAMRFVDEGFEHVVLRDVDTGEELHFRPPNAKLT